MLCKVYDFYTRKRIITAKEADEYATRLYMIIKGLTLYIS